MKAALLKSIIGVLTVYITGCSDTTSAEIKKSLSDYAIENNTALKSLKIDSIRYSLADSTIYYNHFLKLLSERSESFSRMARLRTNLAQSHMNTFLLRDKKDNYSAEKNKMDVDKSLRTPYLSQINLRDF